MSRTTLVGAFLGVLMCAKSSLFAAETVYTQSTLLQQDGRAYFTAEGKGTVAKGSDGWFVYTPASLADNETVTLVVEMTNFTYRAYNQLWVEVDNGNQSAALQFALDRALPQWDSVESAVKVLPSGKSTVTTAIEGFASPGKLRRARMIVRHKTSDYPASIVTGKIRFRMRLRLTDYKLQTHLWDKLPTSLATALPAGLGESARQAGEAKRVELENTVAALKTKALSSATANAEKIKAFEALFDCKDRAGRLIQQAALQVAARSAEQDGKYLYGVVSGADKVSRDDVFTGVIGGELRVSVARGEAEGVQAALYSSTARDSVTATVSALVTADGTRLDPDRVTVHPVGYVKPTYPAYVPSAKFRETIADPILDWTDTADLEAERFQPYWVEASIPEDAKAGDYAGFVSFADGNGRSVSVPLAVKVRRLKLNRHRKLPVVFSSGVFSAKSQLQIVYERDADVLDELADFLQSEGGDPAVLSSRARAAWVRMEMEHRLLVSHNLPIQNIYSSPANVQPKWIRDIRLAECPTIFTIGYDKVSPVVDVVGRHVDALGAKSSSIWFYGYDEISSASAYAGMKKSFGAVKAAYPQVKTFCTALDGTFGEKSDCLEEVDAWVDPEDRYSGHATAADKARSRGKQVWYYPCNWPVIPYANFHLENTGVASRTLMGACAWKKRTDGVLYYSVDGLSPYVDTTVLNAGFSDFAGDAVKSRLGNNGYDVDVTITTSSSSSSGKAEKWESFADGVDRLPPVRVRGEAYVEYFTKSSGYVCHAELRFNYKDKSLGSNGQEQNFAQIDVSRLKTWQTIDFLVTPKGEANNCLFRVYAKSSKAKVIFRNFRVESADGHLSNRKLGVSEPLPEDTIVFENSCYGSFRSNGDGALLYPGPTGPSPSLRLKFVRDGIDDYEYLHQLSNAVVAVREGRVALANPTAFLTAADAALDIPSSVCSSFTSYAESSAEIVAWRDTVADLLDEMCEAAGDDWQESPQNRSGRLVESFETFPSASDTTVTGFSGDDGAGKWSAGGNVVVRIGKDDAANGSAYLRIHDDTSSQHSVSRSLLPAFRPAIPKPEARRCPFAFSFRRTAADPAASLTGCKLKLTAVSPTTGEKIAYSDGADIFQTPSAIKADLAELGTWYRVVGHLRLETLSPEKRRLAIRVRAVYNLATGERLYSAAGEGTSYSYKDLTTTTDDFVLSGFTFFTFGASKGLIDFDDFVIGADLSDGFVIQVR